MVEEKHEEHEHHEHHIHQPKVHHKSGGKMLWMSLTAVFAILFIVAWATHGFSGASKGSSGTVNAMSANEAATKAVSYINNVLLQGQATATLASVTELPDLYNISISIDGKPFATYVTKDGRMLFPSGFDITTVPQAAAQTPTTVPKADKPKVELYVMAFCPYGVAAVKALKPAVDLLKTSADFQLNYIGNVFTADDYAALPAAQKSYYDRMCVQRSDGKYYCSLHGPTEQLEDMHQLCVNKYQPDKFWDYANCISSNPTGDWKTCATQSGVDITKTETCANGTEGLGLFTENIKLADAKQVSGSPTMFINGQLYNGGRTSDTYKQAICSGFNTVPSACSQQLATTDQAVAGNCGV